MILDVIRKFNGVSGIYSAIHRENGRMYIGSSMDIGFRIKRHLSDARCGSMSCFHRALRDFGAEEFCFSVVENCDKDILLERERHYIKLHNSASLSGFNTRTEPYAVYDISPNEVTRARIGFASKNRSAKARFNMSLAQKARPPASMETRARISAALRGRRLKPLSTSHRLKLSAAQRGKVASPESRAKMSAFQRNRKRNPLSASHIANISAAKTGKKLGPQSAEHRAKISASHKARRAK